MHLTFRPTKPGDLGRCFALVTNRDVYGAAEETDVLAFWEFLLDSRTALSRVVEARNRPAGKRILGFGLSVFVTDEFMGEIKATLPCHVGWQIFLRWRKGQRTFLTREETAQSNNSEDGLNLMVVAHGTSPVEVSVEDDMRVRLHMFEAFMESNKGYFLREFLQEMFVPEDKAGAIGLGFKTVREIPALFPQTCGMGLVGSTLMGLHRDTFGFPRENAMLWGLFHPPQPGFRFSELEKNVLESALNSDTDEEIANALDISIWTIKKRWQRIYEKVECVTPGLLRPEPGENQIAMDCSIRQRRRHLLDHLRQHPEEIRPTTEARRTARVGRE